MAEFILLPAVAIGLIIGLVELFFVHADENFRGSHWLGHGLHAVFFAIIFVFVNMNADAVLNYFKLAFPYQDIILRGIIAIIAFAKIAGSAAGAGKAVKEKIWHVLIIVALITATPYAWPILKPVCASLVGEQFC